MHQPSQTIAGEELITFSLDEKFNEIFALCNTGDDHPVPNFPSHNVGGHLAELNVISCIMADSSVVNVGPGELDFIEESELLELNPTTEFTPTSSETCATGFEYTSVETATITPDNSTAPPAKPKRTRGRPPNPNKAMVEKPKKRKKYEEDPSSDKSVRQAIEAKRNRDQKKLQWAEMQAKIVALEENEIRLKNQITNLVTENGRLKRANDVDERRFKIVQDTVAEPVEVYNSSGRVEFAPIDVIESIFGRSNFEADKE